MVSLSQDKVGIKTVERDDYLLTKKADHSDDYFRDMGIGFRNNTKGKQTKIKSSKTSEFFRTGGGVWVLDPLKHEIS